MKKFKLLALISLLIVIVFTFSACNYSGYDLVDTNYHFNRAIIKMPDGTTKEITLKKWADSDNGEQLTLTDTAGHRYLVSSVNCILIEDD